MNFDSMHLGNLESFGEIVAARLTEAKRARVDATAYLLRAQELADVGMPPVYFQIIDQLKDF